MRRAWTVFRSVLRRVMIVGLCLGYVIVVTALITVAYQSFAGPYCDGHRMGPKDTCSIVEYNSSRSRNRIERLNPAGTRATPQEVPADWYHRPGKVRRHVHTSDGMRDFHRSDGYVALGILALLVGVPARIFYLSRRGPVSVQN